MLKGYILQMHRKNEQTTTNERSNQNQNNIEYEMRVPSQKNWKEDMSILLSFFFSFLFWILIREIAFVREIFWMIVPESSFVPLLVDLVEAK